jgi:hypothetical protein
MWNKLFVHQVSLSYFKKYPMWARHLNTNSVYVQEPQNKVELGNASTFVLSKGIESPIKQTESGKQIARS